MIRFHIKYSDLKLSPHAKRAPKFCGTSSVHQSLAEGTSRALIGASPSLKKLARATRGTRLGERSVSRVSRWRSQGNGNPVFDMTKMIHNLAQQAHTSAWSLIVHLQATAEQAGLLPLSDEELTANFWEHTEAMAYLDRDRRQGDVSLARSGDHAPMIEALGNCATRMTDLCAVLREMKRRGLDPYHEQHRRAA